MINLDINKIEHDRKVGRACESIEPNIKEDCIFIENGEAIGFYMREVPHKLKQFVAIANKELRSKGVPKSTMKRSSGLTGNKEDEVLQYSTIIGSVPPKPHMRRPYPTMSSVHNVKGAETFIRAMILACKESEKLIQEITPKI